MFDLGLGCSVTSVVAELDEPAIRMLEASEVATFELNPVLFLRDYDRAVREELAAMLRRSGKRAISYHLPFDAADDLSSPDEAARLRALSRQRALLAEARFFGSELVVLHPSSEPFPQNERGRRADRLRRSLLELRPDLERAGCRLTLELLPRLCMGNSVSELLLLLDGLDELFGVCLDVNHAMGDHASVPQWISTLGKRLYTLHLSDYDGIDERHWLPGTGVLDWAALLAALRSIGYCGPFNYELRRPDESTPESRLAAIETNYRWMRTL